MMWYYVISQMWSYLILRNKDKNKLNWSVLHEFIMYNFENMLLGPILQNVSKGT